MKARNNALSFCLFLLALFSLPPMADAAPVPTKPPGQPAQPTAKAPVQPPQVRTQPSVSPSLVFEYNPKGKPDPFRPFVDAELAAKKKQLEDRMQAQKQQELKRQQQRGVMPLSPLQRQAIEQFKLVGIVGNSRSRKAIVQDASGKFYPIYAGTLMGQNSAKVMEIRESSVLLEEPAAGKAGRSGKKYIEIKLRREGDEGTP